ncbi:hypothetical protein PIB30_055066 [Stylosanthes scabra]|uniref:Uncharacterized protein n=1 Tax=Stylosanthes scabra TaxID=79078 RepID=A0ABU6YHT5_9FABA|nr:hypothetical protein [Stylosanthes scabra]
MTLDAARLMSQQTEASSPNYKYPSPFSFSAALSFISLHSHSHYQNLLRGYENSLYRLDAEFYIAGRLGKLPGRVLRTRRNTLQRSHEFAREYFRRAGFEHVAYMLEWNHDWALASALVERWRPEDRVCQGVGEDATEERLMQYTRGYIMQIIGGMLFPDASDSRVHMRWLPLLEDLDRCGQLS